MQRSPGLDRPLAWAGLLANGAALAGLPLAVTLPGPLATARLVVGLAAVLPALVVGVVACGAGAAAAGGHRLGARRPVAAAAAGADSLVPAPGRNGSDCDRQAPGLS
jgi:hypothetical protein